MFRLIWNLFLLLGFIDPGHARNQPVFELDNANSAKEEATGVEKYWSGRGELASHHLWPAAATLFLTSLLAASFTALKIFVAQTLLVSKLSLAGAALLAAKSAYDHLKHKFQNGGHALDAHPSELLVATPWAWESVGPPEGHEAHPASAEDERGVAETRTREEAEVPVSVRSDQLKHRYRPDLSVEYDTIIKKTTYLDRKLQK